MKFVKRSIDREGDEIHETVNEIDLPAREIFRALDALSSKEGFGKRFMDNFVDVMFDLIKNKFSPGENKSDGEKPGVTGSTTFGPIPIGKLPPDFLEFLTRQFTNSLNRDDVPQGPFEGGVFVGDGPRDQPQEKQNGQNVEVEDPDEKKEKEKKQKK